MSTVLGIVLFILWVWALVDVLKSEFKSNNKIIWLLTVILVPVIGFVLYFLIGRFQKIPGETAETT
jgi:ABC-type molybdate transport system permease subunit